MHARKIYVSKEAPKYSIHREQQLACAGIVTCIINHIEWLITTAMTSR